MLRLPLVALLFVACAASAQEAPLATLQFEYTDGAVAERFDLGSPTSSDASAQLRAAGDRPGVFMLSLRAQGARGETTHLADLQLVVPLTGTFEPGPYEAYQPGSTLSYRLDGDGWTRQYRVELTAVRLLIESIEDDVVRGRYSVESGTRAETQARASGVFVARLQRAL